MALVVIRHGQYSLALRVCVKADPSSPLPFTSFPLYADHKSRPDDRQAVYDNQVIMYKNLAGTTVLTPRLLCVENSRIRVDLVTSAASHLCIAVRTSRSTLSFWLLDSSNEIVAVTRYSMG